MEALIRKKPQHVTCITGETDLDFCLDAVEDATFLFIIDAITTGKIPGTLSQYKLSDLPIMELGISAHNLHLFHMLHDSRKEGRLIGIEAAIIDFHYGLSPELDKNFSRLVQQVSLIIDNTIEKLIN